MGQGIKSIPCDKCKDLQTCKKCGHVFKMSGAYKKVQVNNGDNYLYFCSLCIPKYDKITQRVFEEYRSTPCNYNDHPLTNVVASGGGGGIGYSSGQTIFMTVETKYYKTFEVDEQGNIIGQRFC